MGKNSWLAYLEHSKAAHVVSSNGLRLLDSCRKFRTLEDHLLDLNDKFGLGQLQLPAIKKALSEFAEKGMFVSYDTVISGLSQVSPQPEEDGRVTSLGIITRNRISRLETALRSYIENCKGYDRDNTYLIFDDSPDFKVRDQCRSMLRSLKRRYQVNLRYGGLEEKVKFARALSGDYDFPQDIVEFATLDPEGVGLSIGANRNAMLLDAVGELLFSADDDTVCRIAPHPEAKDTLTFFSEAIPADLWNFPDRESALKFAGPVEEDFLAPHEKTLGKSLESLALAAEGRGELKIHNYLCDHLLSSLLSGQGKIITTFNGVLGDSGMRSSLQYLIWGEGPNLSRLVQSESYYHTVKSSREVLRVAPCMSIVHGKECMAGFIGLDNRMVLPPFLPVCRGEDSVFGVLLNKCYDNCYSCYLPRALLHAPTERRPIQDFLTSVNRIFASNIFAWLILSFPLTVGRYSPQDNLRRLGAYLIELGALPLAEFEEFLRLLAWQAAGQMISVLESRLNTYKNAPRFWGRDLEKYIDAIKNRAPDEDYIVPSDLAERGGPFGARLLSQRLVFKFGRLLTLWPDFVEAAKRLRDQGRRLSEEI